MPDDRLFSKVLGHSVKVNALSDLEEIVWRTYILAANDFGIMRFAAISLQEAHERLAKRSKKSVLHALERVAEVGLVRVFLHQEQQFCCQVDWQNYQRVLYPRRSFLPRPPGRILAECSLATQWLFTVWPGGDRDHKLPKWEPEKDWQPDADLFADGFGGSRTVLEPFRTVPNGSELARAREPLAVSRKPLAVSQSREPLDLRTNLPALPRRASHSVENHETTEDPNADRDGSAMRDREAADRSRSGARQSGVVGAHQGPTAEAGVHVPGRPVRDSSGDEPSRARPAKGMGSTSRSDTGDTGDTHGRSTAASRPSTAATAVVGAVHVTEGAYPDAAPPWLLSLSNRVNRIPS